MVFISQLKKAFEGVVVARLPFTPIALISKVTHFGLPGDDLQDCSMTFFFVLCQMSVNPIVKRLIALEGPKINMPLTPTPSF